MDAVSLHEASHAYITRLTVPENTSITLSRLSDTYAIQTEEKEVPGKDVLVSRAVAGSLGERIVGLWPSANNNSRTMQNLIQELYVKNNFWTDTGTPDKEYVESIADDEEIKEAIFRTTLKLIQGFITDKQFFDDIAEWMALQNENDSASDTLSFFKKSTQRS